MSGSKATILLVAFYNIKALGVRYLEAALRKNGYHVTTVFFKDFNSLHPELATDTEIEQLCKLVREKRPLFVGFSVMSSMYLESVDKVIERVRKTAPLTTTVCGCAFATMFPERFLDMGVNFVIRADGEIPMCRLADKLLAKEDFSQLPSLCYKKEGENVINEIGDILTEIDEYGLPAIKCSDPYYIEQNTVQHSDPQLTTMSYEVIASRGCPFTCSYCCCVNLRRLFPKDTKYVRTRSAASVIAELEIVKKKFKRLVFVHFYDEIFPNQPGWVDEFVREYKKRIHLPFSIWSHPKAIRQDTLEKLVDAGLIEVTMGIQSGSEHIRRDIFHRYESQDDIVESTRMIREAGVFWASYDFMLQHPFESIEDLKETYFLVKKLHLPFELQLHGLNFLPGTDIVSMAIEQGIVTESRMNEIMYAPMSEQFQAYWKQENDPESQAWYQMITCLQYPDLRKQVEQFEDDPMNHKAQLEVLYQKAQKKAKARDYFKKGRFVLRSLGSRMKLR